MVLRLVAVTAVIALFIWLFISFIARRLIPGVSQAEQSKRERTIADAPIQYPELSKIGKSLVTALPGCVIVPNDGLAFKQAMKNYWALQESEVVPSCFVRPRNVDDLSKAVALLKDEYDKQASDSGPGLFAVRGGGHSPVSGAASIPGGVLIDLSLLNQVVPSEDGSTVVIGAGAKWLDVSKVLDTKGLAVAGGRNSDVGVGGLTLGGGLSFFSPRVGLVCNNIISYEIVLADSTITTASATSNPDLWRALKGGLNNFGIVTSFTAKSFPCGKIWSGFLYLPSGRAAKVLYAFHDFLSRAESRDPRVSFDSSAAGPIACFSYVHQLGIQAVAVNLVHTSPDPKSNKWPACWQSSLFSSVFRFWSTCKLRTLASATDEMNALNPPGRRQCFGTTTIKNHLPTLGAAHAAYTDAIACLRPLKVKDLVFTLVLQPMLPAWSCKGDPNVLGLEEFPPNESLVIVSFTVNWAEAQHDALLKGLVKHTLEEIEKVAAENGTGHRYRSLNYCGEWQKPFEGYGPENLEFLRAVSRKYDPDGLFQRGCPGGFKLDIPL